MAYFGLIFFANMGGGGGQNYFQTQLPSRIRKNTSQGMIFAKVFVSEGSFAPPPTSSAGEASFWTLLHLAGVLGLAACGPHLGDVCHCLWFRRVVSLVVPY